MHPHNNEATIVSMDKKIRNYFIIGLCLLSFVKGYAEEVLISVKMEGLTYDTIWFGKTFGRRPLPQQYALKQEDGSYVIKLKEAVSPGFYAIIFKTSSISRLNYFHIAMEKGQGSFSVSCTLPQVFETLRFEGNPESEHYYLYRNGIAGHMADYMKLLDYYRYKMDELNYKFITSKEEAAIIHHTKYLAQHPTGLTASLAQQIPVMAAPRTSDWKKDRELRWQLFTQQYLNSWQGGDSLFWSSPLGIDWLDHYTLGLWDELSGDPSGPADQALTKLAGNKQAFQYYLNYLLQVFSRSSRFDLDKVYVYLVRKYVEKADKSLLGEEEWYRHTNQANNINRLMTGSYLPDLRFYDEKDVPRHVYDLDANYTLIAFWNPDCPHCVNELPILAQLYPEYKAKGLKVITICGKREGQVSMCWQGRDEMGLPSAWYYWADPKAISRFQVIYNIYTIPAMYLLDQNHKIVCRIKGDMIENELALALEKYVK